jgi:hypothetical protein
MLSWSVRISLLVDGNKPAHMGINNTPTRISHGTGVLDDLKLLLDSLPPTQKSTVVADIKFVFSELRYDCDDETASGARALHANWACGKQYPRTKERRVGRLISDAPPQS